MELRNEKIDGIMVLQLSGRFDAYESPAVEQFFQRINTDPLPYVILNLINVNFIDSTGLATLTIGMKRCRQQQGDLILCGMQQPISIIFQLTRLDTVFTLASTLEEAIKTVHTLETKS